MRINTKWTPALDAQLTELAAAGKTAVEIGAALNISRSAAAGRAARIGVKMGIGTTRDRSTPIEDRPKPIRIRKDRPAKDRMIRVPKKPTAPSTMTSTIKPHKSITQPPAPQVQSRVAAPRKRTYNFGSVVHYYTTSDRKSIFVWGRDVTAPMPIGIYDYDGKRWRRRGNPKEAHPNAITAATYCFERHIE